jgi:diaminopimelate decarboxylase
MAAPGQNARVLGPISPRLLPHTARLGPTGLTIGGVPLVDLAHQYGTPLFVYDAAHLRQTCTQLVQAFGSGHVSYASKAFLCTAIAELVTSEGLGLDVASAGELAIALAAGVDPARIVMHGNNKSEAELATAMDSGVRHIVIDSEDEMDRIESLYAQGHPAVGVLARVTPGIRAGATAAIRTAEDDSKFGLSMRSGAAHRAVERARRSPAMNWHGVHSHLGSQILDLSALSVGARIVAEFAVAQGAEVLSLGGGLGVPYTGDMPEAPDPHAWAELLRDAAAEVGWTGPIDVEPGRLLAARAGMTLYTVGTMKTVPGMRTYLAVDGGFSDNLRPALYGASYEAFLPRCPDALRDRQVRVVGKHCESGDVLLPDAVVPSDTCVGDVLATPMTGAYGYSMSSSYNLLGRPAVVFVENGEAREVLRRESVTDLLAFDCGPLQHHARPTQCQLSPSVFIT